jgi:predicted enzyme related to lactoylglutathione lyase
MENPNIAVWFELPVADLDRAHAFYRAVTQQAMHAESMGPDIQMVIFGTKAENTADCTRVSGALVKHAEMRPSADGTVVYLNGGADLAGPLSRVEAAGGQVVLPKTSIAPWGFIALFIDSEGNRVGLHSMN